MSDFDPSLPATDRRAEKAIPMHILTHIGEVVDGFRKDENDRHQRLDVEIADRFDRLEQKIHHLTDSITAYMGRTEALWSAFPGQDPDGHRKAHEAWLDEVRERKEFYATMKKELVKYGLLGLFSWVAFSLWAAFVKGPHS